MKLPPKYKGPGAGGDTDDVKLLIEKIAQQGNVVRELKAAKEAKVRYSDLFSNKII